MTGRIWRANGRIWFLKTGVVLMNSRCEATSAGADRLGERLQLLQRRAEHARGRGELAQPLLGLAERAGQQAAACFRTLWSSSANILKTALEESTSSASCVSLPPTASISSRKLWIECAISSWRTASCEAISCRVARGRVEALERRGQRLSVVLQPFARAGQQLLQVGARFRVERREEFVEVGVRRGLRQRQRRAAAQRAAGGRPRVDLDRLVLQLGLRAQQHRRVRGRCVLARTSGSGAS